ncbi:hypothetical protein CK203_056804 [Vitis vinifera]|uniref:Uncharacterized protein n=1 Tax=Vitis vinifera TaxID=29760 RepID=A0A438FVF7_VITVI|nr:hypothetical protein CK203_056804 [Vitis vinifera]
MNFMSYVAEFSREWDEPNARDMGRMTYGKEIGRARNEPDAEAQAISQTPLQAMPCAICLSYEHLVDECPTIPEREMFGDCNTYNSNWRDHPNFSWKPQPPQYQQPAQAPQQASNLEQAMVNLCKVVGDFVKARSHQCSSDQRIRVDQRIDRMESFANLNTMQEKENSPSQPYQNSMSIHEMEAKREIFTKKEVKEVITLRSGKEVDLPTCKLEHKRIVIKEELMKKHMPPPFLQALYGKSYKPSLKFWMIKIKRNCKEIEGKKSEQIGAKSESNGPKTGEKQGKNRGLRDFAASAKSKFCCETSSQPNCPLCESFRSCETKFGTRVPLRSTVAPFRSCESGCEPPKHEILHFAEKAPFRRVFGSCETNFGTRVPLRSTGASISQLRKRIAKCTVTPISQLRNGCEVPKLKNPNFTAAPSFRQLLDTSRSLSEVQIMHAISRWKDWEVTSPQLQTVLDLDLKRKSYGCLKMTVQTMSGNAAPQFCYCWTRFEALSGAQIMHTISCLKAWEVRSPALQTLQLRAPVEETMPPKETTRTEAKVLIQPTQEATTDASVPQDLTIT